VSHYPVDWAITARDDLEGIAAFIAEDNPLNALKVVERIEQRAASLATLPMRGRVVPELRWHGVMAFQELIERPWRIIYRIEPRRVVVVSVLDGRRSLEDLLLDRFIR
jgi:toxin ParE1/3/4